MVVQQQDVSHVRLEGVRLEQGFQNNGKQELSVPPPYWICVLISPMLVSKLNLGVFEALKLRVLLLMVSNLYH